MTVLETIKRGTEFLAGKGVDSPRLQMELMLAHVLQLPRLKLYLNFERVLTETEVETLRAMVKRRGEREPLQHILGSTSFCGVELMVNKNALIPRPETEILAEKGWTFLVKLVRSGVARPRVLDFGTGTGCLAITLATKCPEAEFYALDISREALDIAVANAKRHSVSDRIHFVVSDAFQQCPADLKFDLLISNPPYIPTAELATLQPEVRDYDPRLALDGGSDGLNFYRHLAEFAPAFLNPEGHVMLEFGDGQSAVLEKVFSDRPWELISIEPDYTGRPRILIARRAAR